MAAPSVLVFDESIVSKNLCKFVVDKANKAIQARNRFTVGVSGGSLAKFLCNDLPALKTEWSKWQIFFCDERFVPQDDNDCTYKFYKENLLSKLSGKGLTEDNIFPVNPPTPGGPGVDEAAKAYAETIRSVFPGDGIPRFDMLLLGMGPDGHTCSLFKDHPLLQETELIVAPITDSPKPPPSRVTMTFPVLNNSACAVFASCGESKAEMVQNVLEPGDCNLLPAARVKPTNGELVWFLDTAAASKLKNKL